ncbi:MAG: AI-2E family transporter [Acidobacteriia bacterium]|nr:AI-2E family transporter [Terriglobia bacterium]
MLGLDPRAARYAWTVFCTGLLLLLVYLVRKTIFVFVVALLLAYLLSPLADLLDRALPTRRTRVLAMGLAYLIFVGVVVLIGQQIGARVVEQATSLARRFPDMLASWQNSTPNPPTAITSLRQEIVNRARTEIAARSGDILATLSQAGLKAITVAGDLIYVVVIPILSFFFLKDGALIRQHILDFAGESSQRVLLDDVLMDIDHLLANYMRALVVLSLAAFTAYSVTFSFMGVPYAVLLSALGGMLEFIPMLGPVTAGAIILIVSIVSGAPVVAVLIFLLAYRVFQDYILSPQLMEHGIALHPLLVLFGVFAGAEIAGIPGTFLSVPILALSRVVYVRIRKSRVGAQLMPTENLVR